MGACALCQPSGCSWLHKGSKIVSWWSARYKKGEWYPVHFMVGQRTVNLMTTVHLTETFCEEVRAKHHPNHRRVLDKPCALQGYTIELDYSGSMMRAPIRTIFSVCTYYESGSNRSLNLTSCPIALQDFCLSPEARCGLFWQISRLRKNWDRERWHRDMGMETTPVYLSIMNF